MPVRVRSASTFVLGFALVLVAAGGAAPAPTFAPVRDVFSVAPDGTGLRNVTRTPRVAETHISISSDGSQLAFVRQGQLVVTGAGGRGERRMAPITLGPEPVAPPSWSPDGSELAYTNAVGCDDVACKTWEIWTVNVATGARRRISADGKDPAWAPDGRRLAYAGHLVVGTTPRGEFSYRTNVVIFDRRTGHVHDLGRGAWPSWASRGRRIAYLKGRSLLVRRVDDGRTTTISSDAASRAAWSPRSGRILFIRGFDDVVLANADGTGLRRIRTGPVELPAWSPQGRTVAWATFVATRNEEAARDDLVVAPISGAAPKTIVRGAPNTRMEAPAWSPRGRIYFAVGRPD